MFTSKKGHHNLGKWRSHPLTVPDLFHWSLGLVTSVLIKSGGIVLQHVWFIPQAQSFSGELQR